MIMGSFDRLTMTTFSSTMQFDPRTMGPAMARRVHLGWRTLPDGDAWWAGSAWIRAECDALRYLS